jgi:hypothetical protein
MAARGVLTTESASQSGANDSAAKLEEVSLSRWKAEFLRELDFVATRDRWGRALLAIGWVHLAAFVICQAMYTPVSTRDLRFLWTWLGESFLVLAAFRLVAGRGWYRASPAAALVVRVWVTFLILALSTLSLNNLTGWETTWFKLAWASLSSFGLAMLAWLIDLRFLLLAVQMWLTGLLMFRFPDQSYLIYGISWWAILEGLGMWLERRAAAGRETGEAGRGIELGPGRVRQ